MAIKDWSTTDLNNATITGTSINWQEGQAPSTLNNSARAVMSDVRAQHEDAEWINFGDNVNYVSGTSFTVPGDLTEDYAVERKIRAVGSATGTIYGEITNTVFSSPNTTVTVSWDSGSLQNESLEVSVGILNYIQPKKSFPAGTKTSFYQAAAPTGWVIDSDTTWNQVRMIAVDNSNGGDSGGSDDALEMDEVPSHTHPVSGSGSTNTTGSHLHSGGGNPFCAQGSGGNNLMSCGRQNTGTAGNHSHTFSFSVTSSANSGAENYTPRYAKFIVCEKL